MAVNQQMYELARQSSEISGVPAEWIYSQWQHESANFTSDLWTGQNNCGGLTQEEENDTPQPDGNYYYMKFSTPEEYAAYFGRYIKKYFPTAARAQTLEQYVQDLKTGEEYVYYGDSVENYMEGTTGAYNEAFG